jgi:glycosyltransferase involved in cell wall biosynthesis
MTQFINNSDIGIYCPDPYPGGELVLTKTLTEALATNYKITLYTCREVAKHFHNIKNNNLAVFELDDKKLIYKRFPKNRKDMILNRINALLILMGLKLSTLPVKEKTVLFPYPTFEILMCPKHECIVYVMDLRHKYLRKSGIKETVNDWLYSKILRRSRLILALSKNTKNDLKKFFDVEDKRIEVIQPIPHFSGARLVEPLLLSRKYGLPDKFIYYPAHMIPMKNHLNLVKAMGQIKISKGQEINLVLVGTIKDKQYYEKFLDVIRSYNLENQIRHLGFLAYEEVLTLYKLATALAMPSFFEGCGIPVLEAFRLGCPVVSSDASALPEQIADAGLLFNPSDVEDMASKIYRIWNDENLRRELKEMGRRRVETLNMEEHIKQWKNVVELASAQH